MAERLKRLRHESVVGRNDQNNDVGDIRTAGTHGGECGVTRGVDESNGLALPVDGICADALGDASGFAGGHLRASDGIEQGGLAVIDVAHEGDDRASELLGFGLLLDRLGGLDNDLLLLVDTSSGDALLALEDKSVEVAELARDLGLHALVDVREDLHPHQILDDLEGRNTHLGGEFLDLDRGLDVDHLARLSTLGILDNHHLFLSGFNRLGRRGRRGLVFPDSGKGLACRSHALLGSGLVDQRKRGEVGGLDGRLFCILLLGGGSRGLRLGSRALGSRGF